jgi:uncharacterized protein YhfF
MPTAEVSAFWQDYLDTLPPDAPQHQETYLAESFGDNPALADELIALVLAGHKTATCSALWEWEADGDPLPHVGIKTVYLDGAGRPACIVETTEVRVLPMDQVDAAFAHDEGEGDQTWAYWHDAHWRYFSRVLPTIGHTPAHDMPLVCERFRVIYLPLPSR